MLGRAVVQMGFSAFFVILSPYLREGEESRLCALILRIILETLHPTLGGIQSDGRDANPIASSAYDPSNGTLVWTTICQDLTPGSGKVWPQIS